MIARCSLETEPWWALAMIVSAPLLCAGLGHDLRGWLPWPGRVARRPSSQPLGRPLGRRSR